MLSDSKVYAQTWLLFLKHECPQKLASLSANGMLDIELARVEKEVQAILDQCLPMRHLSTQKEAHAALNDWKVVHGMILAAITRTPT